MDSMTQAILLENILIVLYADIFDIIIGIYRDKAKVYRMK